MNKIDKKPYGSYLLVWEMDSRQIQNIPFQTDMWSEVNEVK